MNKEEFQEFYQKHKKHVFTMVNLRLPDYDDAKDVVQEIFMELWLKRETLQHIREIEPYLYVISRNQVISAFRRKNIQLKNESMLVEGLNALDHSAEDTAVAKELTQEIDVIVGNFPETTRQCYELSKNQGRKNGEIAHLLNISEKTVRNNISEALKRLRLVLKHNHPEMFIFLWYLIKP